MMAVFTVGMLSLICVVFAAAMRQPTPKEPEVELDRPNRSDFDDDPGTDYEDEDTSPEDEEIFGADEEQ